jgi:DNA-binding CsgD family transcriptional regulator
VLARSLAWRAGALANLHHLPEAFEDGRRALALAGDLGDPTGEAYALYWLGTAAGYLGDLRDAETWLRQAQRIDQAAIPGWIGRHNAIILGRTLGYVGEASEAHRYLAEALDAARQAGALYDQGDGLLSMAQLDFDSGRLDASRAHLSEVVELFGRTGANVLLMNCLELCVDLCAATGRWREAVTVRAASAAVRQGTWIQDDSQAHGSAADDEEEKRELDKAREMLEPAVVRAAEQRGAAMIPAVAAEYVLLLVSEEPARPAAEPVLPHLRADERELVRLVALGRTNAQIAAQFAVSVRTVSSRLDRIRAKTGSQRRADLTRLALRANLV